MPIDLAGPFYPAYKAANPTFSADTFRCAEETVAELLTTATTSENPGMLLGKVQSGKTRTFISILALAFDNGFDIAIVLSKNSKALIEQTAKRLNTEFKAFTDEGELEIYDIMHAPSSFGAFELDGKLIFVAKKQSDNLRRLIDLFSNSPAMTGHRTGANAIGEIVEAIDEEVARACGYNADEPELVALNTAIEFLDRIEPTMLFPDEDAPEFDWDGARAALTHLSQQHPDPDQRGKVWLWAAKDRNSARMASESSHATYIETPDSEKTEGQIAKKFAIDTPILFLLRQNGTAEKGWRDTPFYWPVIRAQANAPTAIYTAETI